jgi:hypothetical protein
VEVIGSEVTPASQYPAASYPWSGTVDAGTEPPFPVDISYVEPVGTAAEIAHSVGVLPTPPLPESEIDAFGGLSISDGVDPQLPGSTPTVAPAPAATAGSDDDQNRREVGAASFRRPPL